MKFSRLIVSVAVAASFLFAMTGHAVAARKTAQPHSDITMELSKPLSLLIPGRQAWHEDVPVTVRVAGRKGRRIIGGLLALGAAAIIANEINRSNRHRYHNKYNHTPRNKFSSSSYDHRRHNRFDRCDRWLRRCDRGVKRACRKFYRRCDF